MDKEAFRTFKINRINFILPTPHLFTENYKAPPLEMYQPILTPIPITLKFHKQVAHRVYEEFDGKAISYDDDGHILVKSMMPEDPWLYAFILSFGPSCQIIEPIHVLENLKLQAKEILNLYL